MPPTNSAPQDRAVLLHDVDHNLRLCQALSRVIVSALAAISPASLDAAKKAIDRELDAASDRTRLRETLDRMREHINVTQAFDDDTNALERALIAAAAALPDKDAN